VIVRHLIIVAFAGKSYLCRGDIVGVVFLRPYKFFNSSIRLAHFVAAFLAFSPSLLAQLSTDDHLMEPGFWPTKSVKSRGESASYDSTCLSCHRASSAQAADAQHAAKACPNATKNCTTCHMPKIEIPFMHDTLTDHKIQIAKAGQPYVE